MREAHHQVRRGGSEQPAEVWSEERLEVLLAECDVLTGIGTQHEHFDIGRKTQDEGSAAAAGSHRQCSNRLLREVVGRDDTRRASFGRQHHTS